MSRDGAWESISSSTPSTSCFSVLRVLVWMYFSFHNLFLSKREKRKKKKIKSYLCLRFISFKYRVFVCFAGLRFILIK